MAARKNPMQPLFNSDDTSKPNGMQMSATTSDSATSISSEEFKQIINHEHGIDLDLGSEKENVANIFGRSESIDINEEELTGLSIQGLSSSGKHWSCDPSIGVSLRIGNSGVSAEKPLTVVEMFQRTAARYGYCLALSVKRFGVWQQWTYDDYYRDCVTVAKAFIKLGLEPCHGVCILGFNAPEWNITSIAAIMAGGLSVGIYLTSTAEACCSVADSCKANIIVVENDSQLHKILQIRPRLTHLKAIIHYNKLLGETNEDGVFDWKNIMKMNTEECDDEFERRMKHLAPNNCCTLIYTSGTTGHSKGAMISHDNITWMCRRILEHSKSVMGEESIVSYLPLSHIAPQILDVYTMMCTAGACWFAQPNALKGSLLETLREVHPTVFLGVPRVWEKIAESMQILAQNTTGIKARISQWAKGVGLKGNLHKQTGGSGMPIGFSLANYVYFKKVRKALGLDNCHFPATGSAPISQDTLTFFMSINIPIHELYGMSETTGPTSMTTSDNIRFRSSGFAINGTDIKIDDVNDSGSGEILIRGRHVFMGYIGEPRSTIETFTEDGWLKTGDIGYVSSEGFVYITGRTKELIVIASGENIAPVPIESAIKAELPIVSHVVLIGDQKRFLSCLITLKVEFDEETDRPTDTLNPAARAICQSVNSNAKTVHDITSSSEGHQILQMIQKAIDKVNRGANCKENKVAKWSILDRDFSIPTGELTNTMKLKRKYIATKYADIVDSLYSNL